MNLDLLLLLLLVLVLLLLLLLLCVRVLCDSHLVRIEEAKERLRPVPVVAYALLHCAPALRRGIRHQRRGGAWAEGEGIMMKRENGERIG